MVWKGDPVYLEQVVEKRELVSAVYPRCAQPRERRCRCELGGRWRAAQEHLLVATRDRRDGRSSPH